MSDHQETYAVAWALFHAECTELGADQDVIATEWAIPAMRKVWLKKAQTALDALALHQMASSTEIEG